MSENRTMKSTKNAMTGVIYKLVGIFLPFMIRTVMIRKLGAEYLGLNSLFISILQVLSLSELGIGNAMVFSMYKPLSEGDTKRVCDLLAVYKKFYANIGVVISFLGVGMSPFLSFLIKGAYPTEVNIYILYYVYLFNTVISYFLFSYKKSILDATQNTSIENTIQMIITSIMYIAQLVALNITKNYFIYVIFIPCATLAINFIRNYVVTKKYKQYVCTNTVDKELVDDLKRKVKALFGYKIGSSVIWFTDSIVISAFLGLNPLATYSNYYYIMNAVIGILAVLYNSILASVGNSLIMENIEKNYKDFIALNLGNLWIVIWCSICLLCLYQPFMELWMGKSMLFSFDIVIVFCLYFYTWMFNKIGNTYINAAGLWTEAFWKPYVSSAINLILNVILINILGVSGVLLSTIIASVLIETPWDTRVLEKYLFKDTMKSYVKQLLLCTILAIPISILTYFICESIQVDNLVLVLVTRLMVCVIVPNVLLFLLLRKREGFSALKTKGLYLLAKNKNRRQKQ